MSHKELQKIRDEVSPKSTFVQAEVTEEDLALLRSYCIRLLDHIAELESEYVNPYSYQ